MTIMDLIANIDGQNEDDIIFAKKTDGKFLRSSEAVALTLTEEEEGLSNIEIANKHCPGFDYFLEVFLIKDLMYSLGTLAGYKSLEQQVDRVIHYAEFDA